MRGGAKGRRYKSSSRRGGYDLPSSLLQSWSAELSQRIPVIMAENTATVPTEAEKMEEISEPSTSAEQADGDDADAEVKRLMGVGKRNLVMKDIRSAVNAFQEASSILGKKYGETADQCADAFYLYGTTLLEMARMESNVLGNALEGMPEEEDEDSEKEDPVVPSASNLDEKEREELREQVYDAMAEKEEKSEKENGEDSKEPDTEEMECEKSSEAPEIQDKKTEGDTVKTNGDAAEPQDKAEGDDSKTNGATETQEKDVAATETQDKAEGDDAKNNGATTETQEKDVAATETQDKAEGAAAETQEKDVAAETQDKAEDVAAETQDKPQGDSAENQEKVDVEAAETQDKAKGDAAETEEKAEAETQEKAEGNTAENKAEGDSSGTQEKGEAETQEKAEGDSAEVEKAMEVVETKPEVLPEAEVSTEAVKNKTEDVETDTAQESEKPEDKTDDKPKDTENSDTSAKPEETATAVEKEDQTACDEAEPMEGAEEEDAESDDNEETDEKENEEEVGNLQLAWEMLDLSKVIFKRQEDKESQLKAAQAYLKLGEVSIESENYTQAVEDFLVCLAIQKEHLVEHDRLLAETHYQLGLCYQYSGKHDEAISHFNQSIAVMEKKMEQLEKAAEESKEESQKEIEELKGLLPDIKEKIEDSKEAQKSMEDTVKVLKETLGGTSSSFPKENGSTSTSAEAEKSGDCTVPVTNCVSDISHLVRKKRKPEESPVKEAKKCKSEPVENGSSNGDAVVPTNEQVEKAEEAENQTPMDTVESTA
ncbi:nuclear autoantigenic sperm protein isoform X1 [Ranitomeya variabilis]|uniref:nuclear autoantigenic sperm protein isoform X1 n=2 Tax=Ranitomeya variabilis TaxID=490064 RepID=UPI004055D27D